MSELAAELLVTEETEVREYTLSDGSRVIKTIVTTRTKPPPKPKAEVITDLSQASPFERNMLEAHNAIRALHGTPPLKLSREMCNFCQEWANVIAKEGKLRSRPREQRLTYGENLFTKRSGSMKITGEEVVKDWCSGAKYYKWYGGEPPGGSDRNSGNFSQVVWRSSERLGVGIATVGNCFFVVCDYDPGGNVRDSYKDNVLPREDNSR